MHRTAASIIALWLAGAAAAAAQSRYADETTSAGWAWAQLRQDRIADFGAHCGRQLDPRASAGWDDPCRQVPPQFLVDVLTVASWRDQLPRPRIRLRGAHIGGSIDLSDADLHAEIRIEASRIDGSLNLTDSHLDRLFSLAGTALLGTFSGERMRSDSAVLLSGGATLQGDVELSGASVAGLDMRSSGFAKTVHANSFSVRRDLLMNGAARFGGEINLSGAEIGGNVEMESSSFAGPIYANGLGVGADLFMGHGATFGGDVTLIGAKIGGNVETNGSSFAGVMDATAARVTLDVLMDHARFSGDVTLAGTSVGGNLEGYSSVYGKTWDATGLAVKGDLLLNDTARFSGAMTLQGARIAGNVEVESSAVDAAMDATNLSVGGDFLLSEHARLRGAVTLDGVQVASNLEMNSAVFSGPVSAVNLSVGRNLFIGAHAAFAGAVTLYNAKIAGNLEMGTASFARGLNATNLNVGDNLLMNGASFGAGVSLVGAQVGVDLDLAGSVATHIDLSRATAQELTLNGLGWRCPGTTDAPRRWPLGDRAWEQAQCNPADPASAPTLMLRNAHFDAFQDSADAWPPLLDLEGFHYDRLGGIGGSGRDDMRDRSAGDWTGWLSRQRVFSTQPAAQLAAALLAAGRRDTAEAVQLAAQERERGEACARHEFGVCAWMTFLSAVAGYGIGLYTFRVLWWVLGLTVLGAWVLRFSPVARRRGLAWRLGASLHRLLPVVELNKDFKDFFDNPPPERLYEPRNLNGFQVAFFSGLAIAGWILGFFLLAAMSGLTQKG